MTFLGILGLIGAAIGGALFALFRHGGAWNPPEPLPTVPETDSPPPAPEPQQEPPAAPQTPSKATLENLCLAIRDFEGQPGDRNYKNNNPGNCRFSPVGYLPMYEPVKKDKDGFAIFRDYATGWLYLRNMIKLKIHNNPAQTILQFMSDYAPPSENPTTNYAHFIGLRLGVDSEHFLVKDLLS